MRTLQFGKDKEGHVAQQALILPPYSKSIKKRRSLANHRLFSLLSCTTCFLLLLGSFHPPLTLSQFSRFLRSITKNLARYSSAFGSGHFADIDAVQLLFRRINFEQGQTRGQTDRADIKRTWRRLSVYPFTAPSCASRIVFERNNRDRREKKRSDDCSLLVARDQFLRTTILLGTRRGEVLEVQSL